MLVTADPFTFWTTSAAPRFATLPDPSARTLGQHVEDVAANFGWPLLPWQRYVADVASELGPDGRWAYPTVVLTVPRQVGKTALVFATMAQRAKQLQGHRAWYTAQTGGDARRTFRDEWATVVQWREPGEWIVRRSNGEESLTWPQTGGHVRVFPPVVTALHGSQADMVALDEAWAHDPEHGEALMQGIVPAQTTRQRRQVWIVSTAGTADSVWARQWVEKGRTGEPGVAIFDWGMADGDDPDDPATWLRCHPAIGQLVTAPDLADFRQKMGREGFARAYLNLWPDLPDPDAATGVVISPAEWAACCNPQSVLTGAPVFAADSDVVTGEAVVGACGASNGPRTHVEVIRAQVGTLWLPDALEGLQARHGGTVALDETGPVGWVVEELERRGVPVTRVKVSQYARACAQLADAVKATGVAHLGDPRLDQAVAVAERAPLAGGWRWDRKRSHGNLAPLVAVTLAYAVAVTHRSEEAPSMIF